MIRKLFIIHCLFVPLFQLVAQVTPRSAFTTMPETLFPYISQAARLDMIDYYDGGIAKKIPNQFGDSARIESIDDSRIAIEYAPGCAIDVVPLHRKSDEIIMVVQTLDTPERDSSIRFYTHDWKQIDDAKLISLPRLADWFSGADKKSRNLIAGNVPFMTWAAAYDGSTATLTLTPTPGDYVAPENRDEVLMSIKRAIAYVWNGKKFVEQR